MRYIRSFSLIILILFTVLPQHLFAQDEKTDKWYFGVSGGLHSSFLDFSNIDGNLFPKDKNLNSSVSSVFLQYEFGKHNRFALRPQISYLKRGGKLTNINSETYNETIDDIYYKLTTDYLDFRLPIILNFFSENSVVRPYIFVAPVFGIALDGEIKLQQDNVNNSYHGYKLDVTDANMASTYLAGQAGAGVKFAVPVADNHCYIGIEATYEFGFSDTYGDKELDGEANDVTHIFNNNYKIEGERKFGGFEISATLSVPFDIFKKKKKTEKEVYVAPEPVVAPVEKVEEVAPVEEKPCYTLDEIITLMTRNESIVGKTICAINDINFNFSESTIKPESYAYLDKLASIIQRMNKQIEVSGHTDNVGSDEFNMNLSKMRAQAVVEYLVKKGVNRNKLTFSYYGKTKPLTENDTEEGRAINRRVEFTILD